MIRIPLSDAKTLELDFRKVADDIIDSDFSNVLTREIAEAVANALLAGIDTDINAKLAALNAAP